MKNVLILLFLVLCGVASGQIINFPDAKFKNALVNTKCVDLDGNGTGDKDADLNDDGEIDLNEALNVVSLIVRGQQISKLDGIEYFKNLKRLNCEGNQLTSLNVQVVTNLVILTCHNNKLTSLSVHGLTNLTDLICYNNQLTSLDAQGLTNLNYLNCSANLLTFLDVTGLTNLTELWCKNNQLTSLNVKGLINLTYLWCNYNQIESLGITGLKNLTELTCHHNQLTSLDVTGLTNLKDLWCNYNQLTSLDVTGLTSLIGLSCNYNKLTSLNITGLTNLTKLWCDFNQLKSLDMTGLTNLTELLCYHNSLTSLNVTGSTNLTKLWCDYNQLTSIDVAGLINLTELDCNNNLLKSIDVSGLTNLFDFGCVGNQLTFLDVHGLTKLRFLYCFNNSLTFINIKGTKLYQDFSFGNNPNLSYICCDEIKIAEIKNMSLENGQNCEVNSYCSFTPGGKFYVIKGKNSIDYNKNGCDDDIKVSYNKYTITNGNNSGIFVSNSTGNYSISIQAGTHTITPLLEYPANFEVTPSSYTVTFPNTSDTITQNFCIIPKGIIRQTNITVIPLTTPARPGFEAKFKIVWENVGNQIESGTLNFIYDETLLDYVSATQTADQVADGIIKWNFTNLLPFEKREITVTLKVNRPTDTPGVNAGDKLYLTASILDNIFTLENTVVGSYDPNDKTCLQGDRVKPDMVGEYVDYLIRFENTGNYAAENVVVKDIIDTKTFDVSTLKITDASHEVYTRIDGNKVEFIFENIQLPFDDANNDGYIAFKIKTLPTLVLGDSLKNLADIYFDYNFPIRTNEAQTTVAFPVFTKDITKEVKFYPNPVNDILNLDTAENWTKAEIYDISGRIMRSISLDGLSIDVSGLESGSYYIRLNDGEKVGLVKFVKM